MATLQERFDDAMFDFTKGDWDLAIAKLQAILTEEPADFDAQLSLGMAYYRKGDYANATAYFAIAEHSMIKARDFVPVAEVVLHAKVRLFDIGSGIEGNVLRRREF